MERINVTITGTRPLLMHAIPKDFGQKKPGRGEKPDATEDAKAALYRDKDGVIAVPSLNLLSCLRRAAVDYKVPGKGKKTFKDLVLSGVQFVSTHIPLSCNGTNPEEAWEVDLMPVNVQRAKIIRARPRFGEWAMNFEVEIVDPLIQPTVLKEMLESAGRFIGLCDYRPLFGLFRVDKFEVIEN